MPTTQLALLTTAVALLGYLLGSLNTAILLSRALGKEDVRRHGSGNAGMTNMLRTYGKKLAAITFAGDFAKVAVAIWLARLVFYLTGAALPVDVGFIAGFAALLGHVFPVYFRFKGGKGVACALCVILCIDPMVFLVIALTFIPLVFVTRIVSLSSVLGAVAYPFLTWGAGYLRHNVVPGNIVCAGVLAGIIVVMHRANIKRLLTGTEKRFGK